MTEDDITDHLLDRWAADLAERQRCDNVESDALKRAEIQLVGGDTKRATAWALVALAAGQRARRIGDRMT